MKDRIGNQLAVGDKVAVALPEAQIFGFVAQMEAAGVISKQPGQILVSCVIALMVDPAYDAVAQLVKVYDPDKHDAGESAEERPN